MTRFLFAAMPAAGHVGPLIPLAHELIARGHEVGWYTGEQYRGKVEATGASFLPHLEAREIDAGNLDRDFTERQSKKGAAKFIYDLRNVFIPAVPGQVIFGGNSRILMEFQNDTLIVLTARCHGATVVTANQADFALLARWLHVPIYPV